MALLEASFKSNSEAPAAAQALEAAIVLEPNSPLCFAEPMVLFYVNYPAATNRGLMPMVSNHHGMFCYFRANKYHITFGFSQGVQLADPLGLLEGTGKGMRHVKIREAADIRPKIFTGWIKQAMAINDLKRKTKP